jgi:purine-binding chemotaxis protein CheW
MDRPSPLGPKGITQPYVILRLRSQQLALEAGRVRRLILMPKVVALPRQPAATRGVIAVRGRTMPLVDLRVLLGMPSARAETDQVINLLCEREQDHRNWLSELEASVREKRPFKLARDPHQCKFGKWYDTYTPDNQSVALLALWRSFVKPHAEIHGIAERVCALGASGEHGAAQALIEATREGQLKAMIGIFEATRQMLRQNTREVAVVLERQGRQMSLTADEVLAIEGLGADALEPLPESAGSGGTEFTPHVARRPGSDSVVLVLDTERLFERCGSSGVAAAA